MAKVAARVMAGASLAELRAEGLLPERAVEGTWAVKEAVLPFNRFPDTDALLGPEMRSTGEVMGVDVTPGLAFIKSQMAAGTAVPGTQGGGVFLSLADRDKESGADVARQLVELGFAMMATAGTAAHLEAAGIPVAQVVDRLGQGPVTAVDLITSGKIVLVINTPRGRGPRADGAYIRTAAGQHGVALLTTVAAARATARGLRELQGAPLQVRSLQSIHQA
jgi:carbamoyl-phosphate synthase large subunit